MASFLTGPAAQLLGAGMQAVGVQIPVGETSAKVIEGLRGCGIPVPPKTWFKRKDGRNDFQPEDSKQSKKNVYDKLESHINGVMQVVKPALELKNLVRNECCKSAERPPRRTSSQSPKNKYKYYTPQKCSSESCHLSNAKGSDSPKKKAARQLYDCKNNNGRIRKQNYNNSSSDDDEGSCMYCTNSKSLLLLPCGRLICPKCDKNGNHEQECKSCKKLTS